jgi:hypothetical protein
VAAVGADGVGGAAPCALSLQVRALASAERFDAALQLCDALAALAGARRRAASGGGAAGDDDEASAAAEAPSAAAAAAAALRADVHARYAHRLFADGSYAEAMSHFAAAEAAPLDVLALFPALLPAERTRAVRSAAAAGRRDAMPTGARWRRRRARCCCSCCRRRAGRRGAPAAPRARRAALRRARAGATDDAAVRRRLAVHRHRLRERHGRRRGRA